MAGVADYVCLGSNRDLKKGPQFMPYIKLEVDKNFTV